MTDKKSALENMPNEIDVNHDWYGGDHNKTTRYIRADKADHAPTSFKINNKSTCAVATFRGDEIIIEDTPTIPDDKAVAEALAFYQDAIDTARFRDGDFYKHGRTLINHIRSRHAPSLDDATFSEIAKMGRIMPTKQFKDYLAENGLKIVKDNNNDK